MSRSALLTLILLIFSHPSLALAGSDPIVGTWTGRVDQPGSGSYQVVMKLSSAKNGSTEYAALKCGGKLSGAPQGSQYEFKEHITHGGVTPKNPQGCIDGQITIELQGENELIWKWRGSYGGEAYTASATLQREIKSK